MSYFHPAQFQILLKKIVLSIENDHMSSQTFRTKTPCIAELNTLLFVRASPTLISYTHMHVAS